MNYNFDSELATASKYAWVMADYVDTHYDFDCVCGKTIVGRNKSELLENFAIHFKVCPNR